jgi:hypothetical protein
MKRKYSLNVVKFGVFLKPITLLYPPSVHKKVYVNVGAWILDFGAAAYIKTKDIEQVQWPNPYCRASTRRPFSVVLKYFQIKMVRLVGRPRQTNCMVHKVN